MSFDDTDSEMMCGSCLDSSILMKQHLRALSGPTQPVMEEPPHGSKPYSDLYKPKMFKFLAEGKKNDDAPALLTELCAFRPPKYANSLLHIMATHSTQSSFIYDLLPHTKDMIMWENSKGDLAFHSAAKAAQLQCLEALTSWERYDCQETQIDETLLGKANSEGDTPLHIALKSKQLDMAQHLLNQYGKASYMPNFEGKTPIYLAIKAEYPDLVKKMIDIAKNHKDDLPDALIQRKSLVHAAIKAQNLEILKEILENFPDLMEAFDGKGRTPLSYAAFKGYIGVVEHLLDKFGDSKYKGNLDGSFPIHEAASQGHLKVVIELQETKQFLNAKGQSILHLAASNGKSKLVSYVLNREDLERLINLKDEDGNTPLHLAALGFHPRVVYILAHNKKVNSELRNKDGLTALDLAEIHLKSVPSFEERLTWMALTHIEAPRSSQSTRIQKLRSNQGVKVSNDDKDILASFKDRVETNMVVATLVAAVTFAAGITFPGGSRSDGPAIGMAVFAHNWAFEVFVICNTAAMYSSILAVVTLIWTQIHDLKLIRLSLNFSMLLLGFALTMMSLEFMMSVFVVLGNLSWLSYVTLGIGSLFLVLMLMSFILLNIPSYIRNPVARFFFSRAFLLLLLVYERSQNDLTKIISTHSLNKNGELVLRRVPSVNL